VTETKQRTDYNRDVLLLQYKLPAFWESYVLDGVSEVPRWLVDMYNKYWPGFSEDGHTFRALRTDRYTFIEYTDVENGPSWLEAEHFVMKHNATLLKYFPQLELYDIKEDPFQLTNLLAGPESQHQPLHVELTKKFKKLLDVLAKCSGKGCFNLLN